ncbi:MAG: hypothetical protein RSE41_00085 [Clostridia bacterium]
MEMSEIVLKSDMFIISGILKKTSAVFWKDLEVGDCFYITNTPCHTTGDGYNRASYYTIHKCNCKEETSVINSQTQMINQLKKFKFVS